MLNRNEIVQKFQFTRLIQKFGQMYVDEIDSKCNMSNQIFKNP